MDNVSSAANGVVNGDERARSDRRIILKFGSRLLTGGTTVLQPQHMADVAQATQAVPDREVVIVSSGAIAAGFRPLGHTAPPKRIRDRQAAAAVGQTRLMSLWADAFRATGREVAQVLLTNDCLTDRRRYVAARQALATLLKAGIVPIVNENDTVSVDEIIVGDNDNLAAMVAALVDADLLALLTDVPGVYDGNPATDPQASVISHAASADELRKYCFEKTSAESAGGMVTKLEAAERAGRYGIPTLVADGNDEGVLEAILRGEHPGTYIEPSPRPLAARRAWMAAQRGLSGALILDDGAVDAIKKKANLLPSGVVGVKGRFRRGDLVALLDGAGVEHARGIVRYDDRDVLRIQGLHTREAKEELGAEHSQVVVRPDRMVLTGEEGKT